MDEVEEGQYNRINSKPETCSSYLAEYANQSVSMTIKLLLQRYDDTLETVFGLIYNVPGNLWEESRLGCTSRPGEAMAD